jgi:hypothetical protein
MACSTSNIDEESEAENVSIVPDNSGIFAICVYY